MLWKGRRELICRDLNQHFSELTVTSDIFNELSAHFVVFVCLVFNCASFLYALGRYRVIVVYLESHSMTFDFIFRIWNLLVLYFISKFTEVISSDLVWNECVVWEQSYFRSAPGKKEHKVTRCGLGTISSELYSHWSCNLQARLRKSSPYTSEKKTTTGYTTIDIWSHFKSKSTCIKQRFCIIFFFCFVICTFWDCF